MTDAHIAATRRLLASASMVGARVDRDYDNGPVYRDRDEWRDRWQVRADAVPLLEPARLDVPFGPDERQKLDVFPCHGSEGPTVIFWHGGFWLRNSKETSRGLVQGIHAAGCHAVLAGYRLAPATSFSGIVDDADSALSWIAAHGAELGVNGSRLILVGFSAGATLAALKAAAPGVIAAIGVGGIYNLEPIAASGMNDVLQVDDRDVERFSPIFHTRSIAVPFVTAFGMRELPAFRTQSEEFHHVLACHNEQALLLPLRDHHHNSVMDELWRPDGTLTETLRRLARL